MQKFSVRFGAEDRRVVRRWRLCVMAVYGSIAAILLMLSAMVSDKSTETADAAGQRSVSMTASRH